MDEAIAILKADHAHVREIFDRILETSDRGGKIREQLFSTLLRELKIHGKIEEEVFYPAFESLARSRDEKLLFYRACEDHHAADVVLAEFNIVPPTSPQFVAKAEMLYDLIQKHMKMEEREMFPRAKALMQEGEMQELAGRMMVRKETLEAQWRRPLGRGVKRVQGAIDAFMPSMYKSFKGHALGALRRAE